MVSVEVLGTPDCPHLPEALERLCRVTERLALEVRIQELRVPDLDEAVRLGFPGSPTVRVNGYSTTRGALRTSLSLIAADTRTRSSYAVTAARSHGACRKGGVPPASVWPCFGRGRDALRRVDR